MLFIGIIGILIITALVAWITPPQTWDSLNYHMPRVAHWAQQQAVRHYATGIEVQNNMPPGAEMLALHVYVLSGGDQWVNFVQWLAMLGSLIGVSLIAKQLGAGRGGQLFAAVFAATLPMGIAQSSSTMTDYVVAFWMVAVASEMLLLWKEGVTWERIAFISLSAGLAILTKPTAFAYLLPFACVAAWAVVRTKNPGRIIRLALFALILIAILTVGHFARNQSLYGHPIGPQDRFDQHANQLLNLRGLFSNTIRNISLHIRTPCPYVNKAFALGIQWLHQGLGLDVNDPRTTASGLFKISFPSTHEILSGNPLQALLIALALIALIWRQKSMPGILLGYAGIVFATSIVFSFLFKWLIFGSRLHLPFFILFAPIIGCLVEPMKAGRIVRWIGVILLLGSLPWLIGLDSRPLIPLKGRSLVGSILVEPQVNLLFANGLYLLEPSRDIILAIEQSACSEVGLMLAGNGVEYTFWDMLGAPNTDVRLEWIVRGTPSERFLDEGFAPCAVICENCQADPESFRNLPKALERAPYRLYLRENQ